MNPLLRTIVHVLAGRPLPPRCTACRHRIWGGNWSDMGSPAQYWHPQCGSRQKQRDPNVSGVG